MSVQILVSLVDEVDADPRTIVEILREIATGAPPRRGGTRARTRLRLERALAARGIAAIASTPVFTA